MKEFFAELKRKVKEPVKSMEDAVERKGYFKKLLWWLLGILLVSMIPAWLEIPVLSTLFTIVSLPAILLVFGDLLMIYVVSKSRKLFENITCKSCGSQITYGDNIGYEVLRVYTTTTSNENRATLKEMTAVSFNCICQVCGERKQFVHDFCTAHGNANNVGTKMELHPLEKQIPLYFQGTQNIVV